jgi:hypothetical protein
MIRGSNPDNNRKGPRNVSLHANHPMRLLAREYFTEEIFSKTFRPTLGPTELPIQRVPGFFPGGKSAGA